MKNAFNRSISGLLAAVLAFQPVLAHAGEIVHVKPDTARPRVDRAYNGTTILNIDTPNAAGVSQDQYEKFSAGDLILNNSPTNVTTQLGGWIEGNPNLTPSNPAKLWIGEVVGGNAAELNGMLEVGGAAVDVVLANEYGITCNGCGFINTGRATLTTGVPALNAAGGLGGFDVRRGTVTITGAGLNPESRVGASDTGRVDVIARAAAIYGRMRAKGLNVVTGANAVKYDWSYDPATGKVTGITPQDGAGAAPALAVDVSALGGMYADAIQMIATERGVGVRIDGEMASGSNLSLSNAGRLSLGSSSGAGLKASQKVRVRSDGPLLLEGSVTSEQGDLVEIRSGDALTPHRPGLRRRHPAGKRRRRQCRSRRRGARQAHIALDGQFPRRRGRCGALVE
ncbi:filamentous hemagglutinin N-terminal domain-containing protein [Sinorhizobium arboris]|uniref:filamentous hemagglutinin N-terminal domain-containing protein n=1 Tax=Sinorhizobium arboris TaxID=76745 RepID=UPI0003F88E55|nr:filamentous hemagglutinin N-terminal domain-containing protein [Sinorhizobium arboris]